MPCPSPTWSLAHPWTLQQPQSLWVWSQLRGLSWGRWWPAGWFHHGCNWSSCDTWGNIGGGRYDLLCFFPICQTIHLKLLERSNNTTWHPERSNNMTPWEELQHNLTPSGVTTQLHASGVTTQLDILFLFLQSILTQFAFIVCSALLFHLF